MESQQRTILITGGTGFIGSNLAMRLLEADNYTRVVLFDRDPDIRRLTGFKSNVVGVKDRFTPVQNRITFVQGDLTLLRMCSRCSTRISRTASSTSAHCFPPVPRATRQWGSKPT
jgi:nucleoside-diphosphate-sugar epimerase